MHTNASLLAIQLLLMHVHRDRLVGQNAFLAINALFAAGNSTG